MGNLGEGRWGCLTRALSTRHSRLLHDEMNFHHYIIQCVDEKAEELSPQVFSSCVFAGVLGEQREGPQSATAFLTGRNLSASVVMSRSPEVFHTTAPSRC